MRESRTISTTWKSESLLHNDAATADDAQLPSGRKLSRDTGKKKMERYPRSADSVREPTPALVCLAELPASVAAAESYFERASHVANPPSASSLASRCSLALWPA